MDIHANNENKNKNSTMEHQPSRMPLDRQQREQNQEDEDEEDSFAIQFGSRYGAVGYGRDQQEDHLHANHGLVESNPMTAALAWTTVNTSEETETHHLLSEPSSGQIHVIPGKSTTTPRSLSDTIIWNRPLPTWSSHAHGHHQHQRRRLQRSTAPSSPHRLSDLDLIPSPIQPSFTSLASSWSTESTSFLTTRPHFMRRAQLPRVRSSSFTSLPAVEDMSCTETTTTTNISSSGQSKYTNQEPGNGQRGRNVIFRFDKDSQSQSQQPSTPSRSSFTLRKDIMLKQRMDQSQRLVLPHTLQAVSDNMRKQCHLGGSFQRLHASVTNQMMHALSMSSSSDNDDHDDDHDHEEFAVHSSDHNVNYGRINNSNDNNSNNDSPDGSDWRSIATNTVTRPHSTSPPVPHGHPNQKIRSSIEDRTVLETNNNNKDDTSAAIHTPCWVAVLFGIINAIICLPVLMSFGSIIYRDDAFAPYMPVLIKLTIASAVVHQVCFGLFSSLSFAVGQVQDAGLIFLSGMATTLVKACQEHVSQQQQKYHYYYGDDDDDHVTTTIYPGTTVTTVNDQLHQFAQRQMLATVTVGLSLCTALLGVGLLMMGRCGLAKYVQLIPTSVVSGYLAYIGWFCGLSGVNLMLGTSTVTLSILMDGIGFIMPGILGGLFIYASVRTLRHMAVLPICIALLMSLFYVALWFTNTTVKEATDRGWIRRSDDAPPWNQTWDYLRLDLVLWSTFPQLIFTELAMILVVALSSSLDVAAIELELKEPLDYNHELKTVGLSNLISGLTGGYTGSYIFSQSIFALRNGIRSRLAGFVMAICQFLFFMLPFPVLSYVPNAFFGSLLTMICIDLMYEWLWDVRRRVTTVEHYICLTTFTLIQILGVEYGIAAGIGVFLLCYQGGWDVGQDHMVMLMNSYNGSTTNNGISSNDHESRKREALRPSVQSNGANGSEGILRMPEMQHNSILESDESDESSFSTLRVDRYNDDGVEWLSGTVQGQRNDHSSLMPVANDDDMIERIDSLQETSQQKMKDEVGYDGSFPDSSQMLADHLQIAPGDSPWTMDAEAGRRRLIEPLSPSHLFASGISVQERHEDDDYRAAEAHFRISFDD